MKLIVKVTYILRVIGVILLCLALVLSGYSLIMSSAAWNSMSGKLNELNLGANLIDRVSFTSDYYRALAGAIGTREIGSTARAVAVRAELKRFESRADTVLAKREQTALDETYAYFQGVFDYKAFLTAYELREDDAERLALDDIYEYMDSLAAPAAPKGKKLPSLSAGQSEAFFPGCYEALLEENGLEALGEYFEFMQVIQRMLEVATQQQAVTSAAAFMDTAFDIQEYAATRALLQSEENVNPNASFIANFADNAAAFAQTAPTKEQVTAMFASEYARVKMQYPAASYPAFVSAVRTCVDLGAAFDGSYRSLIERVRAGEEAAAAASFGAFIQDFSKVVVSEADQRTGIGVVRLIWQFASLRLWFWGVGIALIILSFALRKLLIAGYLKKQTFHAIQDDPDVLLRVTNLKQYFKSGEFVNKAVDDVNFFIKKGEVFGLVGESGCGKTTTGRTIINLYDPTEGDVYFQGLRISSTMNGMPVLKYQERAELKAKIKALKAGEGDPSAQIRQLKEEFALRTEQIQKRAYESEEEKRRCQSLYREKRKAELTEAYQRDIASLTGEALAERTQRYETEMGIAARDNIMTKMQMIFQDPIASINPRMTVREIIAEGLHVRGVKDQKYIDEKVYEMLELVGLVREHADRYPHEFSGGQRQRIGIARAIVLEPDLIIADEPISALDVSIQAQVINLLNELRSKMGLTILFIAHNLSVVKYFSDRIAVMYFGHIVEMTTSEELFLHPLHPYTKSLLSAIPYPDPHYEKTRQRIEYNPAMQHNYKTDKPRMHEITPGHYILCNQAELEQYRRELGLE